MADVTIHPPREVAPGITAIERQNPNGWGLTMTAVALPGGGILVYSPTWLGRETFERVTALGEPRVLVVPNHFHHLAVARYRERWPDALLVASEGAMPRLAKQGHTGLRALDEARPLLPPGATFQVPAGTKTGEVWLHLPRGAGGTLLLCDAFFNVSRPIRGSLSWVLRALKVIPGLRISTTYQILGVRDVRAYRAWTLDALRTLAPTEVVFAHGDVLSAPDAGAQLAAAVEARWPRA